MEKYLLESRKHGPVGDAVLWWGVNSRGYTTDIDKAGRYTKDEAEQICAGSNEHARHPQTIMHKESLILSIVKKVVDVGDLCRATSASPENEPPRRRTDFQNLQDGQRITLYPNEQNILHKKPVKATFSGGYFYCEGTKPEQGPDYYFGDVLRFNDGFELEAE